MVSWAVIVPLAAASISGFTAFIVARWTTRNQWSLAIRKERLEAARRLIAALTRIQHAIDDQVDLRPHQDADYAQIDVAKASLVTTIAETRLILGEDLYQRMGPLLTAIDIDIDCLCDDGWKSTGYTRNVMQTLIKEICSVVPSLGAIALPPRTAFSFNSGRIVPYEGMWRNSREAAALTGQPTAPEEVASLGIEGENDPSLYPLLERPTVTQSRSNSPDRSLAPATSEIDLARRPK